MSLCLNNSWIRPWSVQFLLWTECLLDISFVVDYSDSIRDSNVGNEDNWEYVIDFMVSVVRSITIGRDSNNVGAVSFGMYDPVYSTQLNVTMGVYRPVGGQGDISPTF